MMRRSAAVVIPLFACALALSACGAQAVTVVHVHPRAIASQPGGVATVAAAVEVPVTLDFDDTVTGLHVVAGDTVSQGQPLIDVDPGPLVTNEQELQLRLSAATIAAGSAQAALGVSKDPEVAEGLQAKIQALHGQIVLDQQLVNIAHGHAPTIVAPINGVVLAVNVTEGEYVAQGVQLLQIIDYHRLTVTASLPVVEQPAVDPGAPATVTFPAFPNVTLSGTVSDVSAGTSNNGTTFAVTVDAPNTPDLLIRPGLNAYVRVQVSGQVAMALPKAAVLNMDLDPTVVVVSNGVAHLRPVTLGVSDDNYVQIVGGVAVNDACVIVGNQTLNDGSRVQIAKDEG